MAELMLRGGDRKKAAENAATWHSVSEECPCRHVKEGDMKLGGVYVESGAKCSCGHERREHYGFGSCYHGGELKRLRCPCRGFSLEEVRAVA